MKFKTVFICFTLIIILFLFFVTLIPFMMFDVPTARLFWRSNWPFVLILALVLGGLDALYLSNRRLFSLLEREDWPALADFLEGKVIRQGKYRIRLVRLLANTYLVLSDSQAVMRLENRAAAIKPALVEALALIFGTARILGKDYAASARFFAARIEDAAPREKPWLRWFQGFSLYLDRQYSSAADQFIPCAKEPGDPVLRGLSAFFLAGPLEKPLRERGEEFRGIISAARKAVLKAFPHTSGWIRAADQLKAEIHGAVLSKYLDEAGRWLYAQEQGKP